MVLLYSSFLQYRACITYGILGVAVNEFHFFNLNRIEELLGVHIVQGVPRADESVCRASSLVRTVSSRTSNDGVVLQ